MSQTCAVPPTVPVKSLVDSSLNYMQHGSVW